MKPIMSSPFDETARQAASVDEALEALHLAGALPLDAIKALVFGLGMSLPDAKSALHASPIWAREAREAEAFHEELEDVWRQNGS